jgi:hypothetical protein
MCMHVCNGFVTLGDAQSSLTIFATALWRLEGAGQTTGQSRQFAAGGVVKAAVVSREMRRLSSATETYNAKPHRTFSSFGIFTETRSMNGLRVGRSK